MLRREFIKTTGAVLASTALPGVALAAEPVAQGRMILPINRGWRFAPLKVAGAETVKFDDSKFERVVIPHTNVKLPWHNFDDRSYEFVSTYRRRFKYPAGAKGKRVFVDFEGAMTASTVWINGVALGEYKGGFTPFSFELTPHLRTDGENILVVQVDSTEREDIPPFGHEIDYLTFGGIYREVSLRVVPQVYLDNIFARPKDVLSGAPSLEVDCFLAGKAEGSAALSLEVELRDGERVVAKGTRAVTLVPGEDPGAAANPVTSAPVYASTQTVTDPARHTVAVTGLGTVQLWDLEKPHLYSVHVRLLAGGQAVDEDSRRIGFREAVFTDKGFSLNGKVIKLRGLDRHQTFPFVGQAMPRRVQRKDAEILRKNLHCNIVRTSHYPQSRHFLDACDEYGLLVLEEIPGWQHIGPEPWKQVSIDNVGRMIRRDWNHPSVILWGVRINESPDDHSFYTRTNALAHALDTTRQTGGIRTFQTSEFLEDVYTWNDFDFPLKKPNHPRYLNTEFVGHTYPTKVTDDDERQREHTLRHARIHNQLASDPQYAGGIGWCAFDYNTHSNFGAGDRICYHGVTDIFREPKPAAGFYKSQCDPAEEIVLEPAFHWARSDESRDFTKAVVCSNCDHLKFSMREHSLEGNPWVLMAELDPERVEFNHLKYAPFVLDMSKLDRSKLKFPWGDLKIDGYIDGKLVISKSLSGLGADQKFALVADDRTLEADGADATRVVMRVTDEFGALRTYADDPVVLTMEGPADLIGDSPFSLIGGTGAVWVRAKESAGTVRLTAKHPRLGSQTVEITLTAVAAENVLEMHLYK
ncbi:glycoside hydrolase family 2 TIM barrel-domain containing protein [Granulicella sp. dw_53]|uniref:glycoside hydrolase family 2 protein n=1 Tax=Granulicella sp. dw_53 TaxID=2719792 RepID=UPI001BD3063E|nr:glycoside hydrolase family 2 TIM barrel-domain containing protein [Granulicella sp. dw_53]